MAYRAGCGTGFNEVDSDYPFLFFTTISNTSGISFPNEGQNGRCLKFGPFAYTTVSLTKNIGENRSTYILCLNFKQKLVGGTYFEAGFIADNAAEQIKFRVLGDSGQIAIYRGSTLLTTTPRALTSGIWYYIQFKATIHSSSGSYELRVNNIPWASASGVNTQAVSGQSYANGYKLTGYSVASSIYLTAWIDDIAVLDTSGDTNNDFIPAAKHVYCRPIADVRADFTPSETGEDNYEMVDSIAPDFVPGAEYNSSTTAGHYDLFECEEPEDPDAEVLAVVSTFVAKKHLIGDGALQHIVKCSGDSAAYRAGNTEALGDGYVRYDYAWETDPYNTGSWTYENAKAAKIGYLIPGEE